MDISALQDIGLSPTEVKVFLALIEIGEAKAGHIIQKSRLQSSSAYNALHGLQDKGLVSYVQKSQVKQYRAAPPEAILEYIDLKKREFLKILPEIKARQARAGAETVEFFHSYKGIKAIFTALMADAKRGDVFRTFAVENPEEYEISRLRVYRGVKQLALERGIVMRGVFHAGTRQKRKKDSLMQKRYVSFPLPPNTVILNGKIALITWGDEPSGILIHSRANAEKYTAFFEHMWKLGKR